MKTHNANNERVKREYLIFLKEAKRYSEASLDGVAKALKRFETYTRFKDFRAFHIQQAVGFKAHLAGQRSERRGEALSKATLHSTLTALKNFFLWLAGRPGYRARLAYADAEYFNLSEKEARIATARRDQPAPTLEQINHVLRLMPAETEIEQRDRAVVAFTLLTGARDGAIASMALKHVDLIERKVFQDAREVRTKFSKTFTTWFFPVGGRAEEIVGAWIAHLRQVRLWGPDDPLFPATRVVVAENRVFVADGLDRKFWSTASPIRAIFKSGFARAGLPYFNPHSFRKTLALFGEKLCRTPEEFKAWSQNLGHEKVMTTLTSYGEVGAVRQQEILTGLRESDDTISAEALLAQIAKFLPRKIV